MFQGLPSHLGVVDLAVALLGGLGVHQVVVVVALVERLAVNLMDHPAWVLPVAPWSVPCPHVSHLPLPNSESSSVACFSVKEQVLA